MACGPFARLVNPMRTALLLTPLAVLLAVSLPAAAWWEDCHQDPFNATIQPCPASPYDLCYVVNDVCQFEGCIFSAWVYAEWNGYPGLQRCDDAHLDNCECVYGPDLFIL